MRWPVLLMCIAAAPARADPQALVLAPDQIAVQLVAEVNLDPGSFARPLSLAPDAWFGATSRLTVGIVHSDSSIDRIAPKASLCLREDQLLCTHAYRGSGIDVRYAERIGELSIVPHARALLRDVVPLKPAVTLGAALRWRRGRTAITTDPFLQVGLANTDRGNRNALWFPVVVTVSVIDRIDFEFHSGWNSDIAVLHDGWHVPAEIAVRTRVGSQIDLTAGLGFTSLLGPQNTPKERLAIVSVGWRS